MALIAVDPERLGPATSCSGLRCLIHEANGPRLTGEKTNINTTMIKIAQVFNNTEYITIQLHLQTHKHTATTTSTSTITSTITTGENCNTGLAAGQACSNGLTGRHAAKPSGLQRMLCDMGRTYICECVDNRRNGKHIKQTLECVGSFQQAAFTGD